jgi:phosphotriesterase-related protein
MRVETVRGPIDTSQLGVTLMHEHIFVLSPEVQQNYPGKWNEDERVADAVAQLDALKAHGADTLVDVTVVGLGRDIRRIQRIAAQTSLQILVATGLYISNDLPLYFHLRGPGTPFGGPEVMTDMFVRDITEGIAGTGVKAAILKCTTEADGLTPGTDCLLRAIARAHRCTGVPIMTHTHAATFRGRDQQRVFREEGIDLARVVIGHAGDSTDLAYLRELMDNGSTIGMDRFGVDVMLPLEDRVNTVAQLCAAGYADRMILSHDYSCYLDLFDDDVRAARFPKWSYTLIFEHILPALQARGVTEHQIHQMLVTNARRIFEHQGLS